MNFACTRCGSRDWPNPDSSCPLCNGGREEIRKAIDDHLEAQSESVARFMRDGCNKHSAEQWWHQIDLQTDKIQPPQMMADRLAWLHTEACRDAWQDMEEPPSHYAWADVCALAGFDLVKNYQTKTK